MLHDVLLSPPDTGPAEAAAVARALSSGWIAPVGPDLDAFEREMADRVGVRAAVALSSGTAALHLALLGLGVGPGDVVLTATMTFAATANAVVYTGAEPHFVDCDPVTGNICPVLLEQAFRDVSAQGRRVAAVLPVDLLGKAVDYDAVLAVARRHGVPVLADAAESLGATRHGRAAGSFGDAAIVSFNGNKIMTTSGGGMLLTDDVELATRARYLAAQARQPVAHYEHVDVGYNYRLSNVLAALGRAQLGRLDEMMARRRRHREAYRELVAELPGIEILGGDDDAGDNCWLTAVRLDPAGPVASAELQHALTAARVESRPIWKPLHLQPVFRERGATLSGAAEEIFATTVTLPSGSGMSEAQRDRVAAAIVGCVRGTSLVSA
ncbi:aminotransferase class I/II-fold pyridoxal phosphate-dependent enzyme [Frigoribacterium sp. VKM Ac-2530]|uniref:DegT/DnrJ/EryC1/StrS family aminotransferase n=1 Tax=Frigoribacterium sp. VKM Ac-2530 TaxID=2783822 RepID=UPI00188C78CA|nr:aminotransferase class I/II-fold pyridoxal phosphate-dependent enzyme [Frigoribacterium sp. VKM Ac-2530]